MSVSRRTFLLLGGISLASGATALLATPECADPTDSATEGPFYTPNTPERRMLRERDIAGAPLALSGRVLTRDCRPIARAVVDIWSCDGNGVYDNKGFRLRGHQFTDAEGRFLFETIKPGGYNDYGMRRTPHIHVKVQGPGTKLLTTQLYFPGEPLNERDGLFNRELLVRLGPKSSGALAASFDFVL